VGGAENACPEWEDGRGWTRVEEQRNKGTREQGGEWKGVGKEIVGKCIGGFCVECHLLHLFATKDELVEGLSRGCRGVVEGLSRGCRGVVG